MFPEASPSSSVSPGAVGSLLKNDVRSQDLGDICVPCSVFAASTKSRNIRVLHSAHTYV